MIDSHIHFAAKQKIACSKLTIVAWDSRSTYTYAVGGVFIVFRVLLLSRVGGYILEVL